MNETTKRELKEALENDDAFLSFLSGETRSDEYLELRKKVEAGTHPADDILYHYVMGGLDNKMASVVRDHIAFCGTCAEEVTMLRSEAVSTEESEDDMRRLVNRLPTWDERFGKFVSDLSPMFDARPWFKPMAAAVVCLVLCLTVPPIWKMIMPRDTGALIAESYQADFVRETKFGNAASGLPWGTSGQAFGLASGRKSPAARAFGAGVWHGRQELLSQPSQDSEAMPEMLSPKWKGEPGIRADDWTETSWDIYFQTGQWSFLLRAVAMSEAKVPDTFWEEQRLVLDKIQKEFAERSEKEAKVVNATIRLIRPILGETVPDEGRRKQLASELDSLITYLSPKL
ncbi:hypothetical protein QUF72_22730 [Desulfobacterales bacterium HSG2]|nr:hypothetical protein [Desulfobacterales bacterium HSG2]